MDAASLPNRWWLRVQKARHTGRQMGDKFVLEDAQITKCRQWLVSPGVHNRSLSRYPYLGNHIDCEARGCVSSDLGRACVRVGGLVSWGKRGRRALGHSWRTLANNLQRLAAQITYPGLSRFALALALFYRSDQQIHQLAADPTIPRGAHASKPARNHPP